jgi:hypothetical protein
MHFTFVPRPVIATWRRRNRFSTVASFLRSPSFSKISKTHYRNRGVRTLKTALKEGAKKSNFKNAHLVMGKKWGKNGEF